eukprot:GSChrysophyteH1.ASY1.ANO1.76.1 assembled CDS
MLGKYNTDTANTSCDNCEAGKYGPTTGRTECDSCELFQSGSNSEAGWSYCEAPTGQPTGRPSGQPSGRPSGQPSGRIQVVSLAVDQVVSLVVVQVLSPVVFPVVSLAVVQVVSLVVSLVVDLVGSLAVIQVGSLAVVQVVSLAVVQVVSLVVVQVVSLAVVQVVSLVVVQVLSPVVFPVVSLAVVQVVSLVVSLVVDLVGSLAVIQVGSLAVVQVVSLAVVQVVSLVVVQVVSLAVDQVVSLVVVQVVSLVVSLLVDQVVSLAISLLVVLQVSLLVSLVVVLQVSLAVSLVVVLQVSLAVSLLVSLAVSLLVVLQVSLAVSLAVSLLVSLQVSLLVSLQVIQVVSLVVSLQVSQVFNQVVSLVVSLLPTGQPSGQPTGPPTGQPSGQPTGQPSGQPSGQPTGQPTGQPSVQPSSQPSGQPTGQPTGQPSGRPSSQPSGRPSAVPSGRPNVQPTSQPSGQPSGRPSGQPSGRPSGQPSGRPSGQPSGRPSGQPSGRPSGQPSGRPSGQPSGRPSGQPSGQPTRRPTSQPSGQPSGPSSVPSGHPSTQPTSQPSRQPTGQPSGGPSCQPTGQPSGQPSTQPSSIPSGQPSVQPTCHPSGQPSGQPSSEPTNPTGQPTSQPSGQPTSQPSSQPTGQPSGQPTGQPSTHPSAQPSTQPSSHPSGQPTGLPTSIPSGTPSSVPTTSAPLMEGVEPSYSTPLEPTSSSLVYSESSFYLKRLSDDDMAVSGGCQDWKSYEGGDFEIKILTHRVAKVQIAFAKLNENNLEVEETQEMSCANQFLASEIVNHLAQNVNGIREPVTCGGNIWRVISCRDTSGFSVPAICVNCSESEISGVCSALTSDDEVCSIGDNSVLIAPCSQSVCAKRSRKSLAKVFKAEFVEKSPPPNMLSVQTSSTRNSILLEMTVSSEGSIYCLARESPITGDVSTEVIIMEGVAASAQPSGGTFIGSLVLPSLHPATQYNTFCTTVSPEGVIMSTEVANIQSSNLLSAIETSCCKTVGVDIKASSILADSNNFGVIHVEAINPPSETMQVKVNLIDKLTNEIIPSMIFPEIFTFLPTDTGLEAIRNLAIRKVAAGEYEVTVAVLGWQSTKYEVNFRKGRVLDVIAGTPPIPTLSSAAFSDDGGSVEVLFDSDTDMSKMTAREFPCASLLDFRGSASSICSWRSESIIEIFPTGFLADDKLEIGSTVTLLAGKVKARCNSDEAFADPCAGWGYMPEGTITVDAPVNAIIPDVVISAPSLVGPCHSLPVDLLSSHGSGGREWSSVTFFVSSSTENSNDAADIASLLTSDFSISSSSSIPSSLLVAGSRYNIVVKLCNFLGTCSQREHQFVVTNNVKPLVIISGARFRRINAHSQLLLFSSATVGDCENGILFSSAAGISYRWEVYDKSSSATINVTSISNDPKTLILPKYSLKPGKLYSVKVNAFSTKYGTQATESLDVQVTLGKIIAAIKGGTNRLVTPGEAITLDASASYDEDVDVASGDSQVITGMLTGFSYEWECTQSEPALSSFCSFNVINDVALEPWKFSLAYRSQTNDNTGSSNTVSTVILTVVDAATGRSDRTRLNVIGVAAETAEVSISTSSPAYVNTDEKIKLVGNIVTGDSTDVTWSVESNLGKVDLSEITYGASFGSVPAGTNGIFLALKPSTLEEGVQYVFSLHATMQNGGSSTTASFTIETNAPPQPGFMTIKPSLGKELLTEFTLVASLWADQDLPLYYTAFYEDPRSEEIVTISLLSEKAERVTKLPAGTADSNSIVICGFQIFDAFSAMSTTVQQVIVESIPYSPQDLQDFLTDQLGEEESIDSETTQQTVFLVTSKMNEVQCGRAPDCAALNREPCREVAHTCGVCRSGYIGNSGPGLDPCVSESVLPLLIDSDKNTIDGCVFNYECDFFGTCEN